MSARYTKEQAAKLNIVYPKAPTKYFRERVTKEQVQDRLVLEALQEAAQRAASIVMRGITETRIEIAPLSVNRAWQGKRFKTPAYTKYQEAVLKKLPPMVVMNKPLKISLEFGFSNKASDLDNPVKLILDILCKKYSFDDKYIYEMNVKKVIVKKGKEYFTFMIEYVH